MPRTPKKFAGTWRITDMSGWDAEARDMLVPATVEFKSSGQGVMRFIAVDAFLDCRFDGDRVDFSWMSFDDTDPSAGRGWATIDDDGCLRGMIFIHDGDESTFEAKRMKLPRDPG